MTGTAVAESVEILLAPAAGDAHVDIHATTSSRQGSELCMTGAGAAAVKSMQALSVSDVTQQEDVQQVQSRLKLEDRAEADAETVSRFIRATNGNTAQAAKRLEATLQWRRKHSPEAIVCTACAKNACSHYMHPIGFDRQERPIIYSCNGMATDKSFKTNEAHMISCFEHTIKLMAPTVEQWIWVMDFHGFGLADCNVRLAKAFLDVSASHYPERLGMFLIVDAPRVFNTLWSAIESWVDPKTKQKIRFVSYDTSPTSSPLREEMQQHFSPGTTNWLLAEMAQNRDKRVAKTKAHCQTKLFKQASSGKLAAAAAGAAGSGHEMHGTPALLQLYVAEPQLLMPQAAATK